MEFHRFGQHRAPSFSLRRHSTHNGKTNMASGAGQRGHECGQPGVRAGRGHSAVGPPAPCAGCGVRHGVEKKSQAKLGFAIVIRKLATYVFDCIWKLGWFYWGKTWVQDTVWWLYLDTDIFTELLENAQIDFLITFTGKGMWTCVLVPAEAGDASLLWTTPWVSAGIQAWVLCKSNKHFKSLSHLSSILQLQWDQPWKTIHLGSTGWGLKTHLFSP